MNNIGMPTVQPRKASFKLQAPKIKLTANSSYYAFVAILTLASVGFAAYMIIALTSKPVPKSTNQSTVAGLQTQRSDPSGLTNIPETIAADGKYTTFDRLLSKSNLLTTLKGDGPFLVVVPTNTAFSLMDQAKLNSMLNDSTSASQIDAFLSDYVFAGNYSLLSLDTKTGIRATSGKLVNISNNGTDIFFNNGKVVSPDNKGTNGEYLVIDKVL